MEYRELGRTGVMIPEVGLGTWKYRGGPEPLRRGIELGANLVDTAEMYRTEDAVGVAIKGMRDRVFVATKVLGSNLRYDQVLQAAEKSLRLLDDDCIDLYQIHWPSHSVPIAETMRAMEELVDRGMVRYLGVSNFSVSQMQEAQAAMSHNTIVCNQVLYNLKRRGIERDLVSLLRGAGHHRDGVHSAGRRVAGGAAEDAGWEAVGGAGVRGPGGGEDAGAGGPQLVPDPARRWW